MPRTVWATEQKGVEYEAIGEAGSRNRVTARSWGYYIPAVSTAHGKTEGRITLGLGLVRCQCWSAPMPIPVMAAGTGKAHGTRTRNPSFGWQSSSTTPRPGIHKGNERVLRPIQM
jgi:hypothetical protein